MASQWQGEGESGPDALAIAGSDLTLERDEGEEETGRRVGARPRQRGGSERLTRARARVAGSGTPVGATERGGRSSQARPRRSTRGSPAAAAAEAKTSGSSAAAEAKTSGSSAATEAKTSGSSAAAEAKTSGSSAATEAKTSGA